MVETRSEVCYPETTPTKLRLGHRHDVGKGQRWVAPNRYQLHSLATLLRNPKQPAEQSDATNRILVLVRKPGRTSSPPVLAFAISWKIAIQKSFLSLQATFSCQNPQLHVSLPCRPLLPRPTLASWPNRTSHEPSRDNAGAAQATVKPGHRMIDMQVGLRAWVVVLSENHWGKKSPSQRGGYSGLPRLGTADNGCGPEWWAMDVAAYQNCRCRIGLCAW